MRHASVDETTYIKSICPPPLWARLIAINTDQDFMDRVTDRKIGDAEVYGWPMFGVMRSQVVRLANSFYVFQILIVQQCYHCMVKNKPCLYIHDAMNSYPCRRCAVTGDICSTTGNGLPWAPSLARTLRQFQGWVSARAALHVLRTTSMQSQAEALELRDKALGIEKCISWVEDETLKRDGLAPNDVSVQALMAAISTFSSTNVETNEL